MNRPAWYDWDLGAPRGETKYPTWTENGLQMYTLKQRAQFEIRDLEKQNKKAPEKKKAPVIVQNSAGNTDEKDRIIQDLRDQNEKLTKYLRVLEAA